MRKRIPRWAGHMLSGFLVALALGMATPDLAGASSQNYWPSNGWNGYKVYLSPAYHGGANTGCDGYVEDAGAVPIAKEAASGYGTDLLDRHYYVRVAWGISASAKVSDSNAWGSDMHVAMHSNAKATNCSAGASYGGTHMIYQYSSQIGLADTMKSAIGPSSPGTDDKRCYTPNCSQYSSLAELTGPNAEAAYMEMDFHTYQLGVDWLRSRTWQWRVGYGVDQHWGYPREPYIY